MARHMADNHEALKDAADQRCTLPSSYVKNVTVKFEEKMCETASSRGPLQVQKSRNVRISFRFSDRSHSKLPSGSLTRNAGYNTLKCTGNAADLAGRRTDRICNRPAERQVDVTSGRTSDPLMTQPTNSLYAKKQLSPGVASVGIQKCLSDWGTDVRLATGAKSSESRCGRAPPVNCCVAALNVATSRDVHVTTDSASIHSASIEHG